MEQDVTEAILVFAGRKGTTYTELWFNVLLFKSIFIVAVLLPAEVALILDTLTLHEAPQ